MRPARTFWLGVLFTPAVWLIWARASYRADLAAVNAQAAAFLETARGPRG